VSASGISSHTGDGTFLLDQNEADGANLLLQLGFMRASDVTMAAVAAQLSGARVKQRILAHEYEELVETQHSKTGILISLFVQGKEVGLSADEVMNAAPLPPQGGPCTVFWIARTRPWPGAIVRRHRRVDQ